MCQLTAHGNYSDEELTRLIESGVNVMTLTPGGRAIAGIGGGMVTTKESLHDRRAVDMILSRIRAVAADLARNLSEYERRLELAPGTLRPRLVECGERIVVRDEDTGRKMIYAPP